MRKILILLLTASIALSASAAPVSPEAALERALQKNSAQRLPAKAGAYKLVTTRHAEGRPTLYLFGTSNGFVLTPADDSAPAVLGYGSSPLMGQDMSMPSNFSSWMEFMSRRVALGVAAGMDMRAKERPERSPIETLCKTRWNQSYPYNSECPTDNGGQCVTGCVATAMAQVMRYYEWPAQGQGSLTYEWGNSQISTDFSDYTFDWDNMLDDYATSYYNESQRKAVADLMRACGGSVQMNYSSHASGAVSPYIAPALFQYFNYDPSIRYEMRDYYSLAQWEEMVYNQLKDNGPTVYDGASSGGGHSFVCDGYEGDGYFHINWGWGGMSDGYFLLDILDPVNQGIGGSEYDFNSDQDVMIGLRRYDAANPGTPEYRVFGPDSFVPNPSNRDLAPESTFVLKGGMYNYGPFAIPAGFAIGVLYDPMYSGELYPEHAGAIDETLNVLWGWKDNEYNVPTLADGLYKVNPGYTSDGETWGKVAVPRQYTQFCIASVKDQGQSVRYIIQRVRLPQASGMSYPETIDAIGDAATVSGTLYNDSPVAIKQPVRAELIKDGKVVAATDNVTMNLESEKSADFSIDLSTLKAVENETAGDGKYLLCVSIRNGNTNLYLPVEQGHQLTVGDVSGINGITDDDASRAIYYDLQGRRITNPAPGLYLRVLDGTTTKVLIR